MNRLEKLVQGQPMIVARKLARDWDIQSREEAEEVLYIFTGNGERPIQEVYDGLRQCIKTYSGVIRINTERGQTEKIESLLRSMPIWKQEVKKIEEAYTYLNPVNVKAVH